jgi:hypothetical protein
LSLLLLLLLLQQSAKATVERTIGSPTWTPTSSNNTSKAFFTVPTPLELAASANDLVE